MPIRYMLYVGNISMVNPLNTHLLQTLDKYLGNIIEAIKDSESSEIIWIRKAKS